tara:strand:+ start:1477 stop:2031 length:555 start_codon:yes stop_codon:yes gene_type:complete
MEDIRKIAEEKMIKSVESLRSSLMRLRTGRAHTSLLDHISVDYYGNKSPLSQVANVGVEDPRTLSVTVWDKSMVESVEKAIMESNLGLTPNSAGTLIRIPIPPMTEERRKDLIKVLKSEAEGAKVAVRNLRRDALAKYKELVKAKEMSEDEERKAGDQIQKLTDKYVASMDNVVRDKESEIMEI